MIAAESCRAYRAATAAQMQDSNNRSVNNEKHHHQRPAIALIAQFDRGVGHAKAECKRGVGDHLGAGVQRVPAERARISLRREQSQQPPVPPSIGSK